MIFHNRPHTILHALHYSKNQLSKQKVHFLKRQFQKKNMGRIYLEHLGGSKLFVCTECDTFISNNNECFSKNARGQKGSSYCFKKVVNVTYSEKTEKNYQHFTKDVYCKVCSTKLGVFYEFVPNETIRYLEGKIILEKSAIKQEESNKEHSLKTVLRTIQKTVLITVLTTVLKTIGIILP